MAIPGCLLAFGLRYAFNVSADHFVSALEKRLADHSDTLPKALDRANDRAWEAVGLALAAGSWFDRLKDVLRDGDLKGVRDQIKAFLEQTPTGLELAPEGSRVAATKEWAALRKAKKLASVTVMPADLARRVASLERHGDPAQMTVAAYRAVADTSAALQPEAPHLARLLTAAPEGGSPLLVSAFAFFFRREIETNDELAHGLSFDFLRLISERQERGFTLLDGRTAGILDQFDVLFDSLGEWFAATDAKLDDINAKLDQLVRLRDVTTSPSEPLKVSVTDKDELKLIQLLRGQLRDLPPELVASADWSKLGDTLAAAGLFREAMEAHKAAVDAAKKMADRQAEAEAEYKQFRDACETGDRDAAMNAFRRAVELYPERYTLFDMNRYPPQTVLGIGGFGTVFLAHDEYDQLSDGPRKVAIKAVHDSGWDAVLERDLAETFTEASVLSTLNHPGIVKTLNRGFGDPVRRKRPYMVLEYFDGVTLDTLIRDKQPLPVKDALVIAKQIAEAVHVAHGRGIYHRDIKPANVMVKLDEKTHTWEVKVIDFGLAVKLHVARNSMSVPSGRKAALDRSLAGTLRYCPPEQRNELDADVGPYSDVYAWGKTVLDLLFLTTEPKSLHWGELPDGIRGPVQATLERATLDAIEHPKEHHRRFPGFGPVLNELAVLLVDQTHNPGKPSAANEPPPVLIQIPPPFQPPLPVQSLPAGYRTVMLSLKKCNSSLERAGDDVVPVGETVGNGFLFVYQDRSTGSATFRLADDDLPLLGRAILQQKGTTEADLAVVPKERLIATAQAVLAKIANRERPNTKRDGRRVYRVRTNFMCNLSGTSKPSVGGNLTEIDLNDLL